MTEASSPHGLDTDTQVFFYEQEFYPLSNFSAFRVKFKWVDFDTAEHAYHYEEFNSIRGASIQQKIVQARSAHEVFSVAQEYKALRRMDWDAEKFDVMRSILRAKVVQHEYVYRKLMATGDRELIENSWRDDVWGWGESKNGLNMLGKLWMAIRAELREAK